MSYLPQEMFMLNTDYVRACITYYPFTQLLVCQIQERFANGQWSDIYYCDRIGEKDERHEEFKRTTSNV